MFKLVLLLIYAAGALLAQGPPRGPDMTIDAAVRTEVIENGSKP